MGTGAEYQIEPSSLHCCILFCDLVRVYLSSKNEHVASHEVTFIFVFRAFGMECTFCKLSTFLTPFNIRRTGPYIKSVGISRKNGRNMNRIKQSNTRLVWKESRAQKQTFRLSNSQRSHLLTQQWFRAARTTVLRPKRLTPSLDVFTQTQGLSLGATAFFQKRSQQYSRLLTHCKLCTTEVQVASFMS